MEFRYSFAMPFARTVSELRDPDTVDPILNVEELSVLVGLRQRIGQKLREAKRQGLKIHRQTPADTVDLDEIEVARVIAATRSRDLARATGLKLSRVRNILKYHYLPTFTEGARICSVLHLDPLRLATWLEMKHTQRKARAKWKRFTPEARALMSEFMKETGKLNTIVELKRILAQVSATIAQPDRIRPGAGSPEPGQSAADPNAGAVAELSRPEKPVFE